MAEVLGITSGVAGLVSLGISVCQGLLGYYDSWKDAESSVASMHSSIEAVMKILQLLSSHMKDTNLDAECVEECILSCKEGIQNLQKKLEKVKLTPVNDGWKEKAKAQLWKSKYPFKESTLAKLKEISKELRDNLILALNDLQMQVFAHTFATSSISLIKLDKIDKQLNYVSTGLDMWTSAEKDNSLNELCDWLSPIAGQFELKQSETFNLHGRQDRMANDILQTVAFKSWLSGTGRYLWCPGSPGVGKSTFASFAIDYLGKAINRADTGLAYIYCNYKESESQTPGNLLSDLLRQLILQKPAVIDKLKILYENHKRNHTRLTLPECLEVFQTVLVPLSRTYIVIDALDECPEAGQTRDMLLNFIEQLGPKVSLVITSRPVPHVEKTLVNSHRLEIQASNEDMEHFLREKIRVSSNLKEFVKKDPSLLDIIISTIVEKAQGMFLLASLHLDALATQASLRQVKTALKQLPQSLEITYDQAMERIVRQDNSCATTARKILSWIFYAFRPLTIKEVQHAIATEPGDTEFDADGLVEEDIIISVCAGLVTIQKESTIISMVHYTTQEYFQRRRDDFFPDAKRDIAQACITYLSFEKFRHVGERYELEKSESFFHGKDQIYDPPSTDDWLSEDFDQYWWPNWLPENNHPIGGQSGDGPPGGFHLLAYCGEYWADHVRGELELELKDQILALLSDKRKLSNLKKVALGWYMSNGKWRESNEGIRHFSDLQIAAFMGLRNVTATLLENGARFQELDKDGHTVLHAAAMNRKPGHVKDVVAYLLDNGADIEARNRKGQTALHRAAEHKKPDIMRYLLERGAHANAKDKGETTALLITSFLAREESLQLLIDNGADVNARDKDGKTAVLIAAMLGNSKGLSCLLSKGANVQARSQYAETALHIAARQEKLDVIQCLLDKGADIHARDKYEKTALHVAVTQGKLGVVQYLLDRGADIHARDKCEETVVHSAARRGKLDVVQCLLDSDADPGADDPWELAMHRAAHAGWLDVIRSLLQKGVDIHALDFKGDTALHCACWGRGKAIEVLVQAGAMVDKQNDRGETPLDTATWLLEICSGQIDEKSDAQKAFMTLLRAATTPNILDMVSYIKPIVTQERLERFRSCVRCTELLASVVDESAAYDGKSFWSEFEASKIFTPCDACLVDFDQLVKDYRLLKARLRDVKEESEKRRKKQKIPDSDLPLRLQEERGATEQEKVIMKED
ncbi:MAG: hypothetical protein MMC33_008702 [Icmadophila ericetorum]|nr:hypothetical protein [Icmadophila ericetorum]